MLSFFCNFESKLNCTFIKYAILFPFFFQNFCSFFLLSTAAVFFDGIFRFVNSIQAYSIWFSIRCAMCVDWIQLCAWNWNKLFCTQLEFFCDIYVLFAYLYSDPCLRLCIIKNVVVYGLKKKITAIRSGTNIEF